MVPPDPVLTNKNFRAHTRLISLALALCVSLSACAPPGPRALLEGKKLVDEGRNSEAVPKLEKATSLLPKYAPGWNYLGLAYQGIGRRDQALRAYQTALSQDHKLAAARYNMGCLFLEQTNLPAAIDELRSYTLLQPSALHGWLKLGTAQLRARRLDDAEKSFRTALELHAKHPEALNGLGLAQAQRRRWQDALNYFNAAAAQDPSYAPALLNSGLVSQQQFGARSQALKRYRQYLDLQPRPAATDAVDALVRQLEAELGVVMSPVKPAVVNPPTSVQPKTNAFAGLTPVTRPSVATSAPLRTNLASASASPPPAQPPAVSNVPSTTTVARPPAPDAVPPTARATPARPAEVEVARVAEEIVVKPAADVPVARASSDIPPTNSSALVAPAPGSPKGTNVPRRGFLARLNPFAGKPKERGDAAAPASKAATVSENAIVPAPAPAASAGPEVGGVAVPRYAYLSPEKPSPGSRGEADKAFRRGIKAQQAGKRALAIAEYQSALQADPAFFNAYYNLGLAALDDGNLGLSLAAYETALTLSPESADARYNFALALKSAGYYQDAADQLIKILDGAPEDARAHLAVANIYAQQLRQTRQAREHYLRVLELSPRHSEAAKIRFWLAANP